MGSPIVVITPVVLPWECFCLLSSQCVNFVCNEGNVVQLSASYITLYDFYTAHSAGQKGCVNMLQLGLVWGDDS